MKIESHQLTPIRELYNNGCYLQAYHAAHKLSPLNEWEGSEARVLAGRLVAHLGAPRLAYYHYLKAYRETPAEPEVRYYYALYQLHRRGPYAAWQTLKQFNDLDNEPDDILASRYALVAETAAILRDFATAETWITRAKEIAPNSPWVYQTYAQVRHHEDKHQESLDLLQHALTLHPWYRPAVQATAYTLTLLGRDDEAIEFLEQADQHIECSGVVAQLIGLQIEQEQYEDAQLHLQRVLQLMPLMEKQTRQWIAGVQSTLAYFQNDIDAAIMYAQKTGDSFHEKIAQHLMETKSQSAERKVLPVGFVRQHHMTCAPATLSAVSNYWSMPADHLQVAEEICYNGTSAYNERRWAEENGWYAREFTITAANTKTLIDHSIPFTFATVDLGNAHLQAVLGYDERRQTLLVRDPYSRHSREGLTTALLERYAATGPRGMALVPTPQKEILAQLDLLESDIWDLLHQFDGALETHKLDQATAILEEMKHKDTTGRLTLDATYRLAIYNSNPVAMLAAVEDLLALYPEDERLQFSRLKHLKDLTRHSDLLSAYEQICQKPNVHPIFLEGYAQELTHDARAQEKAISLLRKALQKWPTKESIYIALADALWNQREFDEALELYRFATCLNDKDEFLAQSYFTAAHFRRETAVALNFLQLRYQRLGQKSNLPARTLVWAYERIDRRVDALHVIDESLQYWSDNGNFLLFVADFFGHLSNEYRKRAFELLKRAKSNSKQQEWLRTAARITAVNADLPRSLSLWQEVLKQQPLAMDAHESIANLLLKTEGREAAVAHLQQAVDAYPHHHPLHRLWLYWLRDAPVEVAAPAFRRVIAMDNSDAWVRRQYSYFLIEQRQFQEAAQVAETAYELDPVHPAYHHLQGLLLKNQGNLEEAKRAFYQSIRLASNIEPSVADLLSCCDSADEQRAALEFVRKELMDKVLLGDEMLMYRAYGSRLLDPEELLSQLHDVLLAQPELAQTWSAYIKQLLSVNSMDKAKEYAEKATKRFPLTPLVWADLAHVCALQMDTEGERNALERAYTINPRWQNIIIMLSNVHARAKEWEKSKALLQEAIGHDPLNARYQALLADARWHLDEKETALEQMQYTLTLEPNYDWAWSTLKDWTRALESPEIVIDTARALTKRHPHDAQSWFVLATMLERSEDIEERLNALEKALLYNPRFVDAYDLQAQLLCQVGRVDEARQACKPAAWKDYVPVDLRARAAWIEVQMGNHDQGMQLLQEALHQEPSYYSGWTLLAQWCRANKRDKQYLEAAENMVRLQPHNEFSLGYLGEACLFNKNRLRAKDAFMRAFSLEPHYLFAGYNLFDLYLDDNELERASNVLLQLQKYASGPLVTAREVQLAVKQRNKEVAANGLRELCVMPYENQWPLQTAVDAMMKQFWGDIVNQVLDEAIDNPDAIPEVGSMWMRQRAAINQWPSAIRLKKLTRRGKIGEHATYIYMTQLQQKNESRKLLQFIKKNRNWLKENTYTWGTVGYILISLSDFSAVTQWMADWRKRSQVHSWMLLNLVESLRYTKQTEEAHKVGQYALTLPEDHCTSSHELWLAVDEIRLGKFDMAKQCLFKIDPGTLPRDYLFVLQMIQTATMMYEAPITNRAQTFKIVRKQMADYLKEYKLQAKNEKVRRELYQSTLKQIAELEGGVGAHLWRWLYHVIPILGIRL